METGAPVIKLVPHARRPSDNLRVLGLLPYAGRKGRRLIAFCMIECRSCVCALLGVTRLLSAKRRRCMLPEKSL